MKKNPIPQPIEWHDNITTIETNDLVDISPILSSHRRRGVIQTSAGKLILRKIPFVRQKAIAAKHSEKLSELAKYHIEISEILLRDLDKRTPEEDAKIRHFNETAYPYTLEIVHASIETPTMDYETFEEWLQTLSPDEQVGLINAISGMYVSDENAIQSASDFIGLATDAGIPIDDDLTANNMTAEQTECIRRSAEKRAKQIVRR